MSIALFAIIGAMIDAGVGYWICFSVYSAAFIIKWLMNVIKKLDE